MIIYGNGIVVRDCVVIFNVDRPFVLIYYDLYDGNLLLECFNQIFDAAGDEVVFVEGS